MGKVRLMKAIAAGDLLAKKENAVLYISHATWHMYLLGKTSPKLRADARMLISAILARHACPSFRNLL